MKTIALKEVCDFFGDGDWIESKDQSDSGIRLIQTGNIGIGRFKDRIEKARWISEETFRNLRCTEVIEGDVLVSRLPDPVGRACLIPSLSHKAITAVDCAIIRFDGSRLTPKFFIYYSQSNEYYSTIHPLISGSTRERISREKLGNLLIPYPSILEQKIIVEKLDKAFAEIDSLEKNLQLKEDKTNQLLQSMLNATFNNTKEFAMRKVKLGEIANLINGSTPLKSEKRYWEPEEIPWFTIDDLRIQGKYILSTQKFISKKALDECSLSLAPKNSILLCCTASVGAIAINKIELTTNQQFNAITSKDNQLMNIEFLFYWLLNNMDQIKSMGRATTIDYVSMSKLKKIDIKLPSLKTQIEIVERLDKTFAEIEKLKNQISIEKELILSLRQSILSNAFNFEEQAA